MTIAYPNEIYSTFAFIGMVLAFIPLPWHLQAWNTGTCLYMIWAGLACLNAFVNSIVWKHSVLNVAPVWCDISARFFLGLNVAIPACTLCINRRLYHIASVKTVTISRTEKRRGVMIDLAIGLGIPVFQMIISYIPQGHRFNILEDVGCFPAIYVTPVGFCLVTIWPLMISIVSSVYSFLSIRAFYKTRAQLSAILSNHKNCNTSRYTRLMILAFVETACTLPLTIYVVAATASAGIAPWLGWADTHYNFSRVVQIAGVIWRGAEGSQVESTRWFSILPPYIFFCFFGFAEEAIKNYRSAIQSISKHTGISTMTWGNFGSGSFGSSKGSTTEVDSSGGVLPVYVKRDVHSKRDTMDSFSDMTTSISDGASFDEKIHGEKDGVPDYENIVLPVAGGTLTDLKLDEHTPSTSSNSSTTSLPRLTVPAPHAARPDSSIIEISSIKDDSALKVSDKESRV